MKIRNGFVSNSSTSSFCIYGVCLSESELIDGLLKSGIIQEQEDVFREMFECPEGSIEAKIKEIVEENGVYEIVDSMSYNKNSPMAGLVVESPPYVYDTYIGISPVDIEDNETGLEFKKRVKNQLIKVFGPDLKLSFHMEAWRDG